MATTRSALTEEDIRTLVKGATPDERAAAAQKLCLSIDAAPLSDADRVLAGEILRIMAADAAELVRRALAVTLNKSLLLPHDIAMSLARDVKSIAIPVLSFSPAFTDDDLIEIVRHGGPVRQAAIAQRPTLSSKVTDALAEEGVEVAVIGACANPSADFSEPGLTIVLQRFEACEKVLAAVAYRSTLPLAVTEKLIQLVSGQVREHLIARHGIDAETALKLALDVTERATVDLVDEAGRATDMKSFVAHLAKNKRLTASVLLRALANGQMTFFEHGLAELGGVPHHRTWLMIHDAGSLGLRAVYERAGLPARLFPAFRAAVDTFHSVELDGETQNTPRFHEKLLQRFLTQPQAMAREDVDYLLDRLDKVADVRRRELLAETQ